MIAQVIDSGRFPVKIWTNDIEPEAKEQLIRLSSLPFIHKHVAVMPDVHSGLGSTVGTVIATNGAIIPAAVGVDIGCGMSAIKLPFKVDLLDGKLHELRSQIERSIPVGNLGNAKVSESMKDKFVRLGGLRCFENNSKELLRAVTQVGSLGSGNHFIEICTDEYGTAWLMLHSGSRNIGKVIADVHINGAKKLMQKYFIDLPDPDLAYLVQDTPEFDNYVHDMNWAQEYASFNRQEMVERVLKQIAFLVYGKENTTPESIMALNTLHVDCHHNYSQLENHFGSNIYVTRKGAVSARKDELGIIPGSMGAKSYIVKGLGNEESFCSCSHGAGRRMSRSKARHTFTQDDLINQTAGVECRKDKDVIDEIPAAYKDIDQVMANQSDLVSIEFTLKQLICVKG